MILVNDYLLMVKKLLCIIKRAGLKVVDASLSTSAHMKVIIASPESDRYVKVTKNVLPGLMKKNN